MLLEHMEKRMQGQCRGALRREMESGAHQRHMQEGRRDRIDEGLRTDENGISAPTGGSEEGGNRET
jgi:hypothetical protein